MKQIVNWTKRWSFLIIVVAVGIGYLTVCEQWQVYAAPFRTLQEWMERETVAVAKEEAVSEKELQVNASGSVSGGDCQMPEKDSVSGGDLLIDQDTMNNSENEAISVPEGALTVSGSDIIGQPLYQTVEDDYFEDAVFIGDSRTVGLYEYGGLEETSTFYASTGLTVYKILSASIVEVEGQREKISVEQALTENTFSKIYLMIGINEMGTGTVDSFMEKYSQVVKRLRELQPEATIYLQGIMKVTTKRSEQGDYITNQGIEERNGRIAELADNVNVFYLDVNPLLVDESGGMESSYTFDGVHLKAQYISIWKDYLKNHAVQKLPLD